MGFKVKVKDSFDGATQQLALEFHELQCLNCEKRQGCMGHTLTILNNYYIIHCQCPIIVLFHTMILMSWHIEMVMVRHII